MSKIDLVIPTYNRTDYLRRILDYYTSYAKDFDIIIADSSFPKNKEQNKKLIKTYTKLNILHLNKFSEKLEQHHKFAEMIKYVNTKYCVFCADDDFIVPGGIIDCLKFLKQNPDYAAAHGTYISFYLQSLPFGRKKFIWRFLYPHISITDSTPQRRAASHLKNYTLTLWGVQKTEVVKACHQEFVKAKIDSRMLPVLGELLPDTLTAVHGKIKRLKTFYSARQCFSQVLSSYPSLFDAKKIGIYNQEITKFKNSLIKSMHLDSRKKELEANELLDQALKIYHKGSYQEHVMSKVNALLKKSPKFISQSFSTLLTFYLFSKPKNDWVGLIDNPSSKYYSDFEEIRRCVFSHA